MYVTYKQKGNRKFWEQAFFTFITMLKSTFKIKPN